MVRLREISNTFPSKLETYETRERNPKPENTFKRVRGDPSCLAEMIEGVIKEKELSGNGPRAIKQEWKGPGLHRNIYIEVVATEFRRLLSNLIDNALEAISENGTVLVAVEYTDVSVKLSIKDNGKGIPLGVLSNLGRKGFTYGKPNGSGLGVWSAKGMVEAWGGHFAITSQQEIGTEVFITLPAVSPACAPEV